MATIQVPYGVQLPEDENLKNTNRILRSAVSGVGAVTGAYRSQNEQAAKALLDITQRNFEKAGGRDPSENRFLASRGVVPPEPIANVPIATPVTPQIIAPAGTPAVPKQATSPYSKFKDEYDYANSLSDKDFKAFIDANQDNPNLVGMGYIEGSEKGKPEKGNPRGKFQRIIDRPQPKNYTAEELKSIVPLAQLGVEKRKNELTAEGHGLTREALAEDRKEKNLIAREKIEAKKETDTLSKKTAQTKTFLDSMEAFTDVVTDPKTFEQKKDHTAFLLAADAVDPDQVPAEVKGITQRAKKQFNAWASDQIAKNKKFKDTPELRMELLEAYLKGKIYLPKQAE